MFTTQGPKDMPEPREFSGAEIDRTIRDHRRLREIIDQAGPQGWLDWTLAYRNMVVHRGRHQNLKRLVPIRNRPFSLTPRRRTPIVDSRGLEAVSDAQRSRRYLTLFPGFVLVGGEIGERSRGRTGVAPADQAISILGIVATTSGRAGPSTRSCVALRGGFCSGTLKTFFHSNCTVA